MLTGGRILKPGIALVVLAALLLSALLASGAISPASNIAHAKASHMQWDIVSIAPPGTVNAGGVASASAVDGSVITLTGSGTFVAPREGNAGNRSATGGGTWARFDIDGSPDGSGEYTVTGLVSWHLGSGDGRMGPADTIGEPEDQRSGLAVFTIKYSDGSEGVLVVSCRLPGPNNLPEMFEGITVSKGFLWYVNHTEPVPEVDAERTLFHVVRNP